MICFRTDDNPSRFWEIRSFLIILDPENIPSPEVDRARAYYPGDHIGIVLLPVAFFKSRILPV
jgi:hypothetical protein